MNLIETSARANREQETSQETNALLSNLSTMFTSIDSIKQTTPLAQIKVLKSQLDTFTNTFFKLQGKDKDLVNKTLTFTDRSGDEIRVRNILTHINDCTIKIVEAEEALIESKKNNDLDKKTKGMPLQGQYLRVNFIT